ncbi:hypothetical protein [Segnochrobactrum spirostomi]|uniref:TIGR03067 domain-containing protein n=1 Tax=Segnochrobactrum spirostomi TaxID=2608987 RepID=A0A6A7Y0W7_9HYPH|nr:hypothetical protein [Segnochrobactrum spirostomi]MQT12128.1 hypothetical protein [Segnochrobactrum spirostomi]
MRLATSAVAVLVTALAVAGTPAAAKDTSRKSAWPNLIGTWVGKSRAIVTTNTGHYGNAGTGDEPRFASAELVIEITKEDQGRYIGTITSPGDTEVKLMVVGSDRKTLRTTDKDGTSVGSILGPNAFELCYAQNNPSTVSCVTFHRRR